MAQTPSNTLPLGSKATDFELMDTVTDEFMTLQECKGLNGTVIMFICNHCPFVKHVNQELVRMAKDFKSKGINFVAISSNDAEKYPQDAPDKMKEHAKNEGYIFPYLYDATQKIAKAYQAACTPDFYVFNETLSLVYHGQLDDSRPGNEKTIDGYDIRHAIKAMLDHLPVNQNQKPSIGCSIKWRT